MEIKVGSYYRMRCGGAVRIKVVDPRLVYGEEDEMVWLLNGGFAFEKASHLFDLVSEITEAEYNRIIAGETFSEKLLSQQAISLHSELEALKAENARLTEELEELKEPELFASASLQFRANERRFEAAKSAMMGLSANPHINLVDLTPEQLAHLSVIQGTALLKALEVK
jgi:hypothetical protein